VHLSHLQTLIVQDCDLHIAFCLQLLSLPSKILAISITTGAAERHDLRQRTTVIVNTWLQFSRTKPALSHATMSLYEGNTIHIHSGYPVPKHNELEAISCSSASFCILSANDPVPVAELHAALPHIRTLRIDRHATADRAAGDIDGRDLAEHLPHLRALVSERCSAKDAWADDARRDPDVGPRTGRVCAAPPM
jgi:hypothetical protein